MSEQKTLSRRRFVGAGMALAATAAAGPAVAFAGRSGGAALEAASGAGPYSGAPLLPADRIGIQLYSVRDQVSSIGFARVFEALANMGYKQVEFAGYTQGTGAITVAQIRKLLDGAGLKAIGSHVSPSSDGSMKQILDDANVLGIPHVGVSFIVPPVPPTVSGWQSLADSYNRYGELAAARGVKFYLHNHFQEFVPTLDDPSRCGLDVLLAETDPKLVFLELDIYWAYVGAWQSSATRPFDPLTDYAIPFRNRIILFHVKDGKRDASGGYANAFDDMVDAGQGHIDFPVFFSRLFKVASGEAKRHWYVQERDNAASHPRGSFAASQCSYLYMRHGIVPPG